MSETLKQQYKKSQCHQMAMHGSAMDGGPRVVPLGPLLMGQDKWLGGMSSPCGRYIYGVPGHAPQVLRVTVATEEVDLIGPAYEGKFKWLRGVEIPPDVAGPAHPSGLCLCLPSNASTVLCIDPATQDVFTMGDGHPAMKGDWLWHGGALGDDGCVYGVPCNAEQVLKINPRTREVTVIGPTFEGRQKWYGGIKAASGAIYGIPHTARGVLKIDPATGECSVIGDELVEGGWKWHGGTTNRDGTIIYGFPNHADSVLRIDTTTDTVTVIDGADVLKSGRHRVPQDGKYKYLGGAVARDDNLYCFPCDAERALMINTHTDTLHTIGPEFLHDEIGLCVNKWQNGFACRDGAVYAIPQRAPGLLRVLPHVDAVSGAVTHEVSVIECGAEFSAFSDGKDKFEGGVLGHDGCVYCIPLRAKRVLKLIPPHPS
eukprot:m.200439 g.200439  ORF g.200439 m.200439 type:complete len:428 (+) comp21051_c0_seq1:132-1415(+)